MEMYQLEKPVWDDSDFAVMGWHDTTVWSMLADPDEYEFLLDMDYIFQWVHPGAGETSFKFWVAPVTMVFENAHDVKIHIESSQGGIEVADFHREEPEVTPNGQFTQHTYRFECQEGTISLKATGFRMFVRRAPVLLEGQSFSLPQRGGVSFERSRDAA